MLLTRFVILGDPHVRDDEHRLWHKAIDDVNALAADAVLVLGDLTGPPQMGTHESLAQALTVLGRLAGPWHSIIGNHDLESPAFETDEAAVADWLGQVGRETPWFRTDVGPITVLGLSNTQWRQNPGNHHEIVLNQEQQAWCREQLTQAADRPVLVMCHAPTLGSGLITLTEHHCQVGNAIVNENHMPGQVQKIIHEHPNVLFWCSAHNHVGQHYRDAISLRQGVHYIHTGVISRRMSRDGQRHSRVLDIHDDAILVRTFDHATGRIDKSLDHCEPFSLSEFLAYRRTYHQQKRVPLEPRTMRQGPGSAPSPEATRFVFLSDAHVAAPIGPMQQRLIDWSLTHVKSQVVDRVVLGGDLTHHASADEAHDFLDQLGLDADPIDYLPGNNEGSDFSVDAQRFGNVNVVRGCRRDGEGWPPRTFLLQTTRAQDAAASLEEMLEHWPDQGNVLVLAHFPPNLIDGAVQRLTQKPQQVWWISGHRHRTQTIDHGNLHVHICGGLDPIKVRGQLPALFLIDWDGDKPVIQTHETPETLLHPTDAFPHPVGLAYRDSAQGMIQTANDHGICVLQFHHGHTRGEPSDEERAAIQQFREDFSESFLSLHLPNFPEHPQGPRLVDFEPWLQWAGQAGLDDLTVHLPQVPTGRVFDDRERWLDTPWVAQCRDTYLALAERALEIGAQLSLENHYNKQRVSPAEEKLSSRPWHLIRFVECLRESLLAKGYTAEQAERIGVIFDTGHAFRDATVSKVHGLADWIHRVGPYLQLAHVHQVGVSEQGKPTNHRPITDRLGPMINYAGTLAAIEQEAIQPVPLLIEVRDRAEALTSWRTLTAGAADVAEECEEAGAR